MGIDKRPESAESEVPKPKEGGEGGKPNADQLAAEAMVLAEQAKKELTEEAMDDLLVKTARNIEDFANLNVLLETLRKGNINVNGVNMA